MGHALSFMAKFLAILFAMAILCTFVWQFVGDKLYDCTDDGFLGFWHPEAGFTMSAANPLQMFRISFTAGQ